MYRCIVCWYPAELDDVVIAFRRSGLCICLRCYLREVDDVRPMPAALRRAWTEVLNESS